MTTAIITGASSGIGLDVAREYVKRGGNVVINGRDPAKLAAAAADLGSPTQVATVPGDIGSTATGATLVAAAVDRFGGVDLLLNSAGIFGVKPFVEVTEEELDQYLSINLRGTYLVTQAVVRQMIAQGDGGAIVNIGTVFVDHAKSGVPASAPLAAKGGVHSLTVSLSAELAPERIRVNMVAPGIIRTPLHDGINVDDLAGLALLNSVGEVSDTTAAVLYLADAGFVTGHVLNVDGGYVGGRA